MKKFEIGKTYRTRSIGDHNCIFDIVVIGRTEKTIKYVYDEEIRSSKIKGNDEAEFIQPDRYSGAPIFRANRMNM